jgi:signal transduction histidine kinase
MEIIDVKKPALGFKTLIILSAALLVIILFQSIFEYKTSHRAVMDLLNNQAGSLLLSIARASEKGVVAYEIQQDKIAQHLLTIAEMESRLAALGKLDKAEIEKTAVEYKLVLFSILGQDGNLRYSYVVDSISLNTIDTKSISPLLTGQKSQMTLGFIDLPGNRKAFAVGVRYAKAGIIVLGIDAAELLTLRRTFGAGSVIDDISRSPGVRYAGIIRSGFIMAASKSFPTDEIDSWLRPDSLQSDSTRTRIRQFADAHEVFEAVGPFSVGGESYGEIVIGMETGYLRLLTAKLRRDILWRSVLFLIVAVAAMTGIILQQNNKQMSQRLDEMQKDLHRLEADKALNSKLVAMGELASGVAHEIRNPLNAIGVIIQRLRREFEPKSDADEYKELTAVIKNETERIDNSIKHFLTLARPPVLHKARLNLNDILKNVHSLCEPRAAKQGCLLALETDQLPDFNLDPNLMHQAILNLVENGLAAISGEGRIIMKSSYKDKICFVEIDDSGHGIPDEQKERVFDLYFTTKPSGTGLGLPTVLRIIKEHGGRIDLLDSPLGGAKFRLEIPIG